MQRDPQGLVRRPAFAGRFYPGDPETCAAAAARFVSAGRPGGEVVGGRRGGHGWFGAIVPHAGWACSGAIAGLGVGALAGSAGSPAPDLVVVFGAIHTPIATDEALLSAAGAWATPMGESGVGQEIGARLLDRAGLFRVDERFHRDEHAIEVELPLIQSAWPAARLLAIETPLLDEAPEIGRRVARSIARDGRRAVYLASSDLTHYGPAYAFAPAGVGPAGLAWARDNDRRLLDLVTDLSVDRIVPNVRTYRNACGGGAIAAMLSACIESGAATAAVLRHANSHETLASVAPQPPIDAVGYAAVVVG